MKNLSNTQRKEIAKRYYESFSTNTVLKSRMYNKIKGDVTLKVWTPRTNKTSFVCIGLNTEHNEIFCYIPGFGVMSRSKISKYI